MSASDPTSHIRVTDSPEEIRNTIKKAYCPAGVLEMNPIIATVRYILFPRKGKVLISRKEKFGGDVEFDSLKEFERFYMKQEIHPLDVKQAVSDGLVELLEPVRNYFSEHPDILTEVEGSFV